MRRMMGKQQFTLKRGGNRVFGGRQEVIRKRIFSYINWKMLRMKKVDERRENVCGRQLWMQLLCNCLSACIHRGTIRDDDDKLISVIDNQCMCVVETSESTCLRIMWSHWVAGRWQADLHCRGHHWPQHIITIIWWWWPPSSMNIHLASSFHYSFSVH